MKISILELVAIAAVTTTGMLGCAPDGAEPSAPAPALDDDAELGTLAAKTGGTGWTGTASAFQNGSPAAYQFFAIGSFAGPANTSRKMGVCAVQRYYAGTTCSSVSDCSGLTPPTGGANYCLAPDNAGTKYCYFRGASASWCGGSPATGAAVTTDGSGNATVWAAATVSQPGVHAAGYACFEGCAVYEGSVSSDIVVNYTCVWDFQTSTFICS